MKIITACGVGVISLLSQIYIMSFVARYTSRWYVQHIRRTYNEYEIWMYGNDTSLMDETSQGYLRGRPENFCPGNFDSLSSDAKNMVCFMSFSQLPFLFTLLYCWTVECGVELRSCLEIFVRVVVRTPTIDNLGGMLEFGNPDEPEQALVVGIPWLLKVDIVILAILPRLVVTAVVHWTGLVWLSSALTFEELVENALALSLVIHLKDSAYEFMYPGSHKRETEHLLVAPLYSSYQQTYFATLLEFNWLWLAVFVVYFYIAHLQPVLPNYLNDVQVLCRQYLWEVTHDPGVPYTPQNGVVIPS